MTKHVTGVGSLKVGPARVSGVGTVTRKADKQEPPDDPKGPLSRRRGLLDMLRGASDAVRFADFIGRSWPGVRDFISDILSMLRIPPGRIYP